jgi:DNA-directed RNA polymerase subunit RPC12/RpoP
MRVYDIEPGCNFDKPIKKVEHASLEKVDEKLRKSVCPACSYGWLLMKRDPETFKLLAEDFCLLCGQRYQYIDIERVRLEIG